MKNWSIAGVNTFLSSVVFFYSHATLVLISLIPSLFRSFQMWHSLDTPVWMEIVVELTRIVLFLLIIVRLSEIKVHELFQKETWNRLGNIRSIRMEQNWPHIFIAQLIVFIVILYGLMNLLIHLVVNISLSTLTDSFDIQKKYEAVYNTCLFFLKNMSVIPLSMVYILKMCGIGPIGNSTGMPDAGIIEHKI